MNDKTKRIILITACCLLCGVAVIGIAGRFGGNTVTPSGTVSGSQPDSNDPNVNINIGLCLTAFLQATILIAGLMVFKDHALLGLGLMLSAGEIPRIAGAFGLDTTTRANIMSAVYTAQAAVNTTRTIVQAVSK